MVFKKLSFVSILATVLLAGVLSSCQDDLSRAVVVGETSFRAHRVSSEIAIMKLEDGDGPATKSSFVGDSEATINDWSLIQVENGSVKRVYTWTRQSAGDNTDISNIEVVYDRPYDWYALANVGGSLSISPGDTQASVEATVLSYSTISSSTFPMAWKSPTSLSFSKADLTGDNPRKLEVTFTRLVSKWNVVLDKSQLSAFSFSVLPKNSDDHFPDVLVHGAGTVKPFAASKATADVSIKDRAAGTDLTTLNGGSAIVFYTLENMNGSGYGTGNPMKQQATTRYDKRLSKISDGVYPSYIEVSGYASYNDGSALEVPVTYRFYLGKDGASTYDNFDVQRNLEYTVTLKPTDTYIENAIREAGGEDITGDGEPIWKVEAGPYTDSRSVHWEHEAAGIQLPSDGTALREGVTVTPAATQTKVKFSSELISAGVRIFRDASCADEVTPATAGSWVTVGNVGELYYTVPTTAVPTMGTATIATLDLKHQSDLTVRVGRFLTGVSLSLCEYMRYDQYLQSMEGSWNPSLWPRNRNRRDTVVFVYNQDRYYYSNMRVVVTGQYSDGTEEDIMPNLSNSNFTLSIDANGVPGGYTGSEKGTYFYRDTYSPNQDFYGFLRVMLRREVCEGTDDVTSVRHITVTYSEEVDGHTFGPFSSTGNVTVVFSSSASDRFFRQGNSGTLSSVALDIENSPTFEQLKFLLNCNNPSSSPWWNCTNSSNLTLESLDPSVVAISGSGDTRTLTAVGVGTTKIRAHFVSPINYTHPSSHSLAHEEFTKDLPVTVTRPRHLDSIKVVPNEVYVPGITANTNKDFKLYAYFADSVTPEDITTSSDVTWTMGGYTYNDNRIYRYRLGSGYYLAQTGSTMSNSGQYKRLLFIKPSSTSEASYNAYSVWPELPNTMITASYTYEGTTKTDSVRGVLEPVTTLVGLTITPATINTWTGGKMITYVATATFDDASTMDVSDRCTWTQSTGKLLNNGEGVFTTLDEAGTETVTASFYHRGTTLTATATANIQQDGVSSITLQYYKDGTWVTGSHNVNLGSDQTYRVLANYASGDVVDVTTSSTLYTGSAAILSVNGLTTHAASVGTTNVWARAEGKTSNQITLTVQDHNYSYMFEVKVDDQDAVTIDYDSFAECKAYFITYDNGVLTSRVDVTNDCIWSIDSQLDAVGYFDSSVHWYRANNTGSTSRSGNVEAEYAHGTTYSDIATITVRPAPYLNVTDIDWEAYQYGSGDAASISAHVNSNVSWTATLVDGGSDFTKDGNSVYPVAPNLSSSNKVGRIEVTGGGMTEYINLTQYHKGAAGHRYYTVAYIDPQTATVESGESVTFTGIVDWYHGTSASGSPAFQSDIMDAATVVVSDRSGSITGSYSWTVPFTNTGSGDVTVTVTLAGINGYDMLSTWSGWYDEVDVDAQVTVHAGAVPTTYYKYRVTTNASPTSLETGNATTLSVDIEQATKVGSGSWSSWSAYSGPASVTYSVYSGSSSGLTISGSAATRSTAGSNAFTASVTGLTPAPTDGIEYVPSSSVEWVNPGPVGTWEIISINVTGGGLINPSASMVTNEQFEATVVLRNTSTSETITRDSSTDPGFSWSVGSSADYSIGSSTGLLTVRALPNRHESSETVTCTYTEPSSTGVTIVGSRTISGTGSFSIDNPVASIENITEYTDDITGWYVHPKFRVTFENGQVETVIVGNQDGDFTPITVNNLRSSTNVCNIISVVEENYETTTYPLESGQSPTSTGWQRCNSGAQDDSYRSIQNGNWIRIQVNCTTNWSGINSTDWTQYNFTAHQGLPRP